jgi:hypothetical protein
MQSYVHHLQAWLRVRCPLAEKQSIQAVQKILKLQPRIRECEFNTFTGSILIRYGEAFISAAGIVSYLKGLGYNS